MAAVTTCNDFGVPQNKVSHCFLCFPICLPWSDGTGCHDLCFLNIEFWGVFWFLWKYLMKFSFFIILQLKSLRNKAKTRLPLYNSHVDSTVLGAACITQSSQTWLVSEVQELQCPLTSLTLPTKVHLVKPMVFPVVMYGCESWTIRKAEHQRIDASVENSTESLGLQGDQTSQS